MKEYFIDRLYNLPRPEDKDINKWCDIIELLCLTNKDYIVSKGDLISLISQENIGSNLEEQSDEIYNDDVDYINENQILKISQDFGSNETIIQDRISQLVNDWFELLQFREAELGAFYPFKIVNDFSALEFSPLVIAENQYFYLYLLLSSNLKLFDKSTQSDFAAHFELFAFSALGYLFPDAEKTKKYIFGKGKFRDEEFKGLNKFKLISKLASMLGTTLNQSINEQSFYNIDTGEEGLDLVAWVDFKDKNPGKLIVFGQCACGVEWEDKAFESSEMNWEQLINCTVLPNLINTLFIPRSFSVSSGWAFQHKIKKTILFDRSRILHCANLSNNLTAYLHKDLINELIN